MMPSAKMREALERAAREHVEHVEDAAALGAEQLGEPFRVDSRHRDVGRRCGRRPARRAGTAGDASGRPSCRCPAVSPWQPRFRSPITLPSPGSGAGLSPERSPLPSARRKAARAPAARTLPPAASIAARAPLETSRPLSATLRLISPARITLARSAGCGTTPAALSAARSMASAAIACEVREPHFRGLVLLVRIEAALRQPPLQRHLAAFEADLVIAAGARLLALVPAPRGLAVAADAPSHALVLAVRARRRLDLVQPHIIPRTSPGRTPR